MAYSMLCMYKFLKNAMDVGSSTCMRGFVWDEPLGSSGTARELTWRYDRWQADRSVFTLPPSHALASFSPSPSPALALALEPLVALLQAPQEVQGQHLPE